MHRLFFPSCAKKTNRVTRRHNDRPDKTLLLGRQPSHGARNIFLLCIIRVFSRAVLEEEREGTATFAQIKWHLMRSNNCCLRETLWAGTSLAGIAKYERGVLYVLYFQIPSIHLSCGASPGNIPIDEGPEA